MNNIAANIKQLRSEKGLSQEQFAQSLHVTRQTVSSWERGLSRPSLEGLQQMAEVLEVEAEKLLYGPEKTGKPTCRSVSFKPVLAVIPAFFVCTLFVFPLLLSFLGGGSDAVLLLGGQLFLAVQIALCYCLLKDEIRNREFYKLYPPEGGEPTFKT